MTIVNDRLKSKLNSTRQYIVNVNILTAKLEKEASVFCEVTAVAPTGRENCGIEGTKFKSQVVLGSDLNFQHRFKIFPLDNLDGSLRFELKEKGYKVMNNLYVEKYFRPPLFQFTPNFCTDTFSDSTITLFKTLVLLSTINEEAKELELEGFSEIEKTAKITMKVKIDADRR